LRFQVDVRALKETLWHRIHDLRSKADSPRRSLGSPSQEELSFQDLIGLLPENGPAGRLSDLSVHLCFICLLHLANEHGLRISSVPSLDRLCVSNLPALAEEVLL
jgi:condensin complex subunit 2